MEMWRQLVNAVAWVLGDPVEHLGEPGLRIEAVHLGGFDEDIGDGGSLAHGRGERPEPDATLVEVKVADLDH